MEIILPSRSPDLAWHLFGRHVAIKSYKIQIEHTESTSDIVSASAVIKYWNSNHLTMKMTGI